MLLIETCVVGQREASGGDFHRLCGQKKPFVHQSRVSETAFRKFVSTKQTNEQNRTRDLKIKNKQMVTRGEGDNGEKKRKEQARNVNRGLMDTDREGRD